MKQFELRWTKQIVTRFFGQLIRPGGVIFVPAGLAVQKHDANDGWVCSDIDGARAVLSAAKDAEITADQIQKALQIDGLGSAEVEGESDEVLKAQDGSSGTITNSGDEHGCDVCGAKFPSKRKLTVHKNQVHPNA